MSRLTEAQFDAAYNESASGSFPDNSTRLITEAVIRQFGQDLKDSFVFAYAPVEITGTASISKPGKYTYTGGAGTLTLYAGASSNYGKEVTIAHRGTDPSDVTVNDSGATAIRLISYGEVVTFYYDNITSTWIEK
jgi:hypothetical protein